MTLRQIVALGGGGFSHEGRHSVLDNYTLSLAKRPCPSVCFVPTASGDATGYIENFYAAFPPSRAKASHVSLRPVEPVPHSDALIPRDRGFRARILAQDIIYVGGGNTIAMLAVWRAVGFDVLLREAWDNGVILTGLSAGSLCWFESGTTDAGGNGLSPFHGGLGFLPGSHSPHYSSEPERRPAYTRWVRDSLLPPGYAADDDAALHFVGAELSQAISSRADAAAYRVTPGGETRLNTLLLA